MTIEEMKNISFRPGRGYKGDEVDAFIDEVIVTVEQLKKEKSDLVRKMDILATRVEQYRADEETVRNALLNAQKAADTVTKEANAKAAKIVADAEQEAQNKLKEANAILAKQKELYIKLKADSVNLRSELESIYKSHLKTIGEFPTDAVLVKNQEELDKKYPTTPVEEPAPVEEEPTEEPEAPAEEEAEFVAPVSEDKFSDLRFGDNYDVDGE